MEWVSQKWGAERIRGTIDKWGAPRTKPYNTKASAFWRAVGSVTQLFVGNDDGWPSKVIWSNLYKVAKYTGGNPSVGLRRAQQDACERHLVTEIRIWMPKRVLFLTGWDWARPFVEKLGACGQLHHGHVQWSGRVDLPNRDAASIVVCVHPQGRRHAEIVKEIMDAFARINGE